MEIINKNNSVSNNHEFSLVKSMTESSDKYRIIWICNIGAEKFWHNNNVEIVNEKEDVVVNHIEEINLLLCRKQDILILREMPENQFLQDMEHMGFQIPTILIPKKSEDNLSVSQLILKDEELMAKLKDIGEHDENVRFVPYAVTSLEEKIAELCNLHLIGSSSGVNKNINNKIINRKIAKDLKINVCMGGVCSTSDDIEKTYDELLSHKDKFEKVVIKRPTGASGKGIYIIENKSKLRLYLKRILKINSEPKNQWLVEGWYRKKHDLSFQIYISEQGNVEVFSLKEQILNDAVYIGSKFPAELEVKDIMSIKEYAYKIGKYIFNMGFTGIAGVDSIITADGTIIPIIEINGRMTLTTYLSYVGKTLNQKCYMSRYIRVGTSKPFPYSEITKVFKDEGILMDQASKKGVLIYNSRTLPSDEAINEGLYIGRIFVIIAGENWTEVDEYNKKLDKCVAKFNLIRVF